MGSEMCIRDSISCNGTLNVHGNIDSNGVFYNSNKVDISSIVVNGGIVDLSNASMVIVPQLTQDNSSNNVATTGYVRSAISDLIGGAPNALDTLKEIADLIGEEGNPASGLIQQIETKQTILSYLYKLDA